MKQKALHYLHTLTWNWRWHVIRPSKDICKAAEDRFRCKGQTIAAFLQRMLNGQDLRMSEPSELGNGFAIEIQKKLPILAIESIQGPLFKNKNSRGLLCRFLEAAVDFPYQA